MAKPGNWLPHILIPFVKSRSITNEKIFSAIKGSRFTGAKHQTMKEGKKSRKMQRFVGLIWGPPQSCSLYVAWEWHFSARPKLFPYFETVNFHPSARFNNAFDPISMDSSLFDDLTQTLIAWPGLHFWAYSGVQSSSKKEVPSWLYLIGERRE